ncbi:hypothetical protein [Sulfobacillus thermosulfidooxidans]|uniref:hypothetical protein n=1 Tax=Sulfobacillus thermosulfidooxidans TaxID=28034 RepID=UPI0009FD9FE9|nr:hypothetical protein [Sulfobacillus thermosulfidooxidans]
MEHHDADKEGFAKEGLALASWRTRNVWGFSLASLFSDMGHELVTTVLPAFLLTIGAPVFALAVIEGISNFSQSLSSLSFFRCSRFQSICGDSTAVCHADPRG